MNQRIARIVATLIVVLSVNTWSAARQRISLDQDWRFKLGHGADPVKDFGFGTGGAQFAKAGGGGAVTTLDFDDMDWRMLDLPHDWAPELPFERTAETSHGHKPLGRAFPATSIGWYRKVFDIPQNDRGQRVSIEFDGVFRDCQVWVNGHYFGRHESGYSSFAYDVTEAINFGGSNVVTVRVDATQFEGWFYEGAGIYRHVWLVKTDPVHVARYGTQVITEVGADNDTKLTIRTKVANDSNESETIRVASDILDAQGQTVATATSDPVTIAPFQSAEVEQLLKLEKANLWSPESAYLYRLSTRIVKDNEVDSYVTNFGVRTIQFTADRGFLLNGKQVVLKGTCNHQDHAGVGSAIPDALQEWRIMRLKEMGSNAIRTSHNPPTPELLDICDRVGMLVMDEHRLMGTAPELMDQLDRLILRDRNHPSVVIWCIGNEEGGIHASDGGAQIAATMQRRVKELDPTRVCTYAMNGAWGRGMSNVIDVMGFNYKRQAGGVDRYREQHPNQPLISTEEASTLCTRGEYADDREKCFVSAYDRRFPGWGATAEDSWTFYAGRPHIAGLFIWTGFDYRGEPNPYGWPAISSQFGIMDTCGLPKDNFYYYQAWWGEKPMLHLFPHWNWAGKEGQDIDVRCFTNCDEVELFVNDQSQGRKAVVRNSHVAWIVRYQPGMMVARGYKDGRQTLETKVETTGAPAAIKLLADRSTLRADGRDVAVVNVAVLDAQGRIVPIADNDIRFKLEGGGQIIGVGNGNPASHEPDQFIETIASVPLTDWRMQIVDGAAPDRAEVAEGFDDSTWRRVTLGGRGRGGGGRAQTQPVGQTAVYRANLNISEIPAGSTAGLGLGGISDQGWVYINGKLAGQTSAFERAGHRFAGIDTLLKPGKNVVAVVARSTTSPVGIRRGGTLRIVTPAPQWRRRAFNGWAQVIVRTTAKPAALKLSASSDGLSDTTLELTAVDQARN
jgi:beta-galactosidase